MENLFEIFIIGLWTLKEVLINLFEKKKFKEIVEQNKDHIKKNSELIEILIRETKKND